MLRLSVSLATIAFLFVGCGPNTGHVSGTVTIDGQPLEKGVIVFVPADSDGEPARGDVLSGKYRLRMTPGKKKVQISAPGVVRDGKYDTFKDRLPPQYHSATTLEFEVKAGRQTKDWPTATN
jgi:hypothetical protein